MCWKKADWDMSCSAPEVEEEEARLPKTLLKMYFVGGTMLAVLDLTPGRLLEYAGWLGGCMRTSVSLTTSM